MKLDQAIAMNNRFVAMKQDIDSLNRSVSGMYHVSDSLATDLFRANIQLASSSHKERISSLMFFSFWGAFVSYLHFFK